MSNHQAVIQKLNRNIGSILLPLSYFFAAFICRQSKVILISPAESFPLLLCLQRIFHTNRWNSTRNK